MAMTTAESMRRRRSKHNRWDDHYTHQARKERYPARSVYKLREIQQKFKLIRPGAHVLDLGCYPGSWLLYAAQLTGAGGSVVGIDIKPVAIELPAHVRTHCVDINQLTQSGWDEIGSGFDVVISDMAPATTGIKDVDAARSLDLCLAALSAARALLTGGGAFVCKIFQGPEAKSFSNLVEKEFKMLKIFKPQSSRKKSREIYIIGLGKTGGQNVRT